MWKKATVKDAPELCKLFFAVLRQHRSYSSHGEMQMGITDDKRRILDCAEENWCSYIIKKIRNKDKAHPSVVLKYQKAGKLIAFGVFMITDDGYHKFGMICDMVVHPKFRRHGLGSELFGLGKDWFASHNITDIYLESGISNHSAHNFYKHRGFKCVSYVYKLK